MRLLGVAALEKVLVGSDKDLCCAALILLDQFLELCRADERSVNAESLAPVLAKVCWFRGKCQFQI